MEPKILLVEDEKSIAKPLIQLLRLRGYPVTWSPSGEDALQRLHRNQNFSCFLIDIIMPNMNGWALRDKITEFCNSRPAPTIFLSADNISARKAQSQGDLFVAKPIDLKDLDQKLKQTLSLSVLISPYLNEARRYRSGVSL